MHKTIKLSSNDQLGYFLRITKKVCAFILSYFEVWLTLFILIDLLLQHERDLRGQKRFTILETRNDGVKFTTSTLQGISEEHRSLKDQYSSAQASVAEEVMKIAGGYAEPMQIFSDIVAQLDVLVSFAVVAMTAPIPYTRPTITSKGETSTIPEGVQLASVHSHHPQINSRFQSRLKASCKNCCIYAD